jgi:hypothetical protein
MNLRIILFGLVATTVLSSCNKECSEDLGAPVEVTRQLSDFTKIENEMGADVILTQGESPQVIIAGPEGAMEDITTQVTGDKLTLKTRKNCLDNEHITFYVTYTDLIEISVSGAGDVTLEDTLTTSDLNLHISGSADMCLPVIVSELDVAISGSGELNLIGSANNYEASVSGSGDISSFDLTAKNASFSVSGSGKIKTTVTDHLKARISGSGTIYYKGSPQIDFDASGSGNLVNQN